MDQFDNNDFDEDFSAARPLSRKRSRDLMDDKYAKHLQQELFECKAVVDGWAHVLVCMELEVIHQEDVKMCIASFIDAITSKMARIERELESLGTQSRKR